MVTKEEISKSLEDCMGKKSLDKITIIDITESSGVSRQMFYHYFSDRVDLVRFVCGRYVKEPLYADKMFFWEKAVLRLIQSKTEYEVYYRNILHSKYAKLLKTVIQEELYSLYYSVIRYRICRTLPNELADMLKAFCAASAEIFCEWLEDGEHQSPMGVRNRMLEAMPMQIRVLITERAISVEDIFRERKLLNWAYEG